MGQLVERKVGAESSAVAAKIIVLLGLFLRDHRFGKLFGSDATYTCFATAPGKIRRANVSFIRYERLPARQVPKGNLVMAPDLAIEVVSPMLSKNDQISGDDVLPGFTVPVHRVLRGLMPRLAPRLRDWHVGDVR